MALELGAEVGARAGCCAAVKCRNSPAAKELSLEREPQPELQLPGSTEGVDACSHPDAVHVVACASSAVNLPGGSRQ
jgi:hypothetical protein